MSLTLWTENQRLECKGVFARHLENVGSHSCFSFSDTSLPCMRFALNVRFLSSCWSSKYAMRRFDDEDRVIGLIIDLILPMYQHWSS